MYNDKDNKLPKMRFYYKSYRYKYSLVLLETWYSDDEASLLRNVNNNKYGLIFQFNFSMGFVSRICRNIYLDLSQSE